jgi:hypothetical protein
MDPFPEEYELISFFEGEPEVLDHGVPWCYNRLTFRTKRGENKICCAIEPGYGILIFSWEQRDKSIASINLEKITSIEIISEKGIEKLLAKFDQEIGLMDFELELKPNVNIKWGIQQN